MTSGAMAARQKDDGRGFITTEQIRRIDHRFYLVMALAMAAIVFAGFARTYYAKNYFHAPALPLWVHMHGAVFTAWIVFYLSQTLLAAYGGLRLHRRLGVAGGVLAAAVVFFGSAVALRQAREGRSFPFLDPAALLAVSFGQMFVFALFVSLGLWFRRDAETHKRLILMATEVFLFPALARLLHGVNALTLLLLCFYCAGPAYDFVTRRRTHGAYRWGLPLLVLAMPPFTVSASHAGWWHSIVSRIVK